MPSQAADSNTVRTDFAPSACPAARVRSRRVAQRPFPSMMIATCISVPPGCFDDCLDMLQVPQQSLSADLSDAVARLGAPRFEGLRAGDVTRFFELARMGAQVAVADIEQRFQFVEGEFFVGRESAHDAESHALVDQAVQSTVLARSMRSGDGFGLQFGFYCALFHRILAF